MQQSHPLSRARRAASTITPAVAAALAADVIEHNRAMFGDAVMNAGAGNTSTNTGGGDGGDNDGDDGDGPDTGTSNTDDGDNDDDGQDDDNDDGDGGYPADTPTSAMTDAQRAAYWKARSRKHQRRAESRSDYAAIRAERDELRRKGMTDAEKAADDARTEGENRAAAKYQRRLVQSEMRSVLRSARYPDEQITAIVDGLDHNRFLASDGEVDADKVSTYAAGLVPAGTRWPDMGQGQRGGTGPSRGDAGRAEAERRFAK